VTSHKPYTSIHYQYTITLVLNYMGCRLYLSFCIVMVGGKKGSRDNPSTHIICAHMVSHETITNSMIHRDIKLWL
jgi:hypothetical protein